MISLILSGYDQEIPQSQTVDKPMAPRGRATRKQPIIALYFESETVLQFYNLEAW